MVSSPVKGLIPLRALVAGFRTTVSFIRPGTVYIPGPRPFRLFLIWPAMASNTATTCFFASPVDSAISDMISPLVIGRADASFFAMTCSP